MTSARMSARGVARRRLPGVEKLRIVATRGSVGRAARESRRGSTVNPAPRRLISGNPYRPNETAAETLARSAADDLRALRRR
jgi:hypothetical protein